MLVSRFFEREDNLMEIKMEQKRMVKKGDYEKYILELERKIKKLLLEKKRIVDELKKVR